MLSLSTHGMMKFRKLYNFNLDAAKMQSKNFTIGGIRMASAQSHLLVFDRNANKFIQFQFELKTKHINWCLMLSTFLSYMTKCILEYKTVQFSIMVSFTSR